jgi:hypothetical protein
MPVVSVPAALLLATPADTLLADQGVRVNATTTHYAVSSTNRLTLTPLVVRRKNRPQAPEHSIGTRIDNVVSASHRHVTTGSAASVTLPEGTT